MSRDSEVRDSERPSKESYFEQFSSKEVTPLLVDDLMKEAYKDTEEDNFFSPMDSDLL